MSSHGLWVERYRPQDLSTYVGNEHLKSKVERFLNDGNIPHLLLYGRAGGGKTTLAKIIVNNTECDYLYINASDERNIDLVRDKLKTFRDSIKSVQESMADVVVSGIKGMEDALVKFVETGKLNFSDLARSIIADMARIAIQQSITKPLTNFFSGLFSKSANGNAFVDGQIQKYAYGGIVNRPTMFPMRNGMGLMGEAGSEAILPLRRGANGKLGVESSGGGSTIINVSVDASGTAVEGNTGQANEFGNVLAAAIQAELINQKRAGGLLSNA